MLLTKVNRSVSGSTCRQPAKATGRCGACYDGQGVPPSAMNDASKTTTERTVTKVKDRMLGLSFLSLDENSPGARVAKSLRH